MISNLARCASAAFLLGSLGACAPSTPPAQEPAPAALPPTSAPSNEIPATDVGGAASTAGGTGNSAGSAAIPAAPPEKMCGGIAGIRCGEKQYCSFAPEARCGAGDMSGTCAPKPDACTLQLDEVCGCDGKTYGNACAAAQAGISVAMKGACGKPASTADTTPEGGLCGTRGVPKDCAPGLYCAYKADCGATDAGGSCTKRPTMCTKIYAPVCGCDGKTYASGCTASAAGVSIARKGECKP